MNYLLISLIMSSCITINAQYWQSTFFKFVPHNAHVTTVLKSPYIVKISNFVTHEEIEELKRLAQPLLERSLVENGKVNPNRTSSSAFLYECRSAVVKKIEARAARMLGLPDTYVEGLQVVNYKEGQEYKYHYDYYPEDYVQQYGSQRKYTFFVYLNDLAEDQGGGTHFPELGITITPRKGTAVFWYNLDKDGKGNPQMLHAGLPVLYGEKWGANIWIHDKPYNRNLN